MWIFALSLWGISAELWGQVKSSQTKLFYIYLKTANGQDIWASITVRRLLNERAHFSKAKLCAHLKRSRRYDPYLPYSQWVRQSFIKNISWFTFSSSLQSIIGNYIYIFFCTFIMKVKQSRVDFGKGLISFQTEFVQMKL